VYVVAGAVEVAVVGGAEVVVTSVPRVWQLKHWAAVRPVWSAGEPAAIVNLPGVLNEPFQVGGNGNWLAGAASGGA
jgi:hypothetical protein